MPRKGQAEFALILGLVIIAVVVGMFAYSSVIPPTVEPSSMTSNQREAQSFAVDAVEESVLQAVSKVYSNGGYAEGTVRPLGMVSHKAWGDVPYWQMCDNFAAPVIEEQLTEQIKKELENIPERTSIAGKEISFNKFFTTVSANVLDNRITVDVALPTVFDGVSLPSPYTIQVQSSLGRITDFAYNFGKMQSDCRVLDLHLMSSLGKSSENAKCFFPFTPGNAERRHTLTWANLKDCMESHVRYSLTNTIIGHDLPSDEEGKILFLGPYGFDGYASDRFYVPTIPDYAASGSGFSLCGPNGVTGSIADSDRYRDLNIQFRFGDDDGLDRNEFKAPEVMQITPRTGDFSQFMQGTMIAEYSQTFSVNYPVLVTIWDDDLGEPFVFATFVYMDNSDLGQCQGLPVLDDVDQDDLFNHEQRCVRDSTEDVRIVLNSAGGPLRGAEVYFVGCLVGNSGPDGIVDGTVPPWSASVVIKYGDKEYDAGTFNYPDLQFKEITVPDISNYNFHFNTVNIDASYAPGTPSTEKADELIKLILSGTSDDTEITILNTNEDFTGTVDYMIFPSIPAVEYDVSAVVQDFYTDEVLGFVEMEGFTPSGNNIYVYVPSVSGLGAGGITADVKEGIKNFYSTCNGLEVMRTTPWSGICE